jgi:hypothetical protein
VKISIVLIVAVAFGLLRYLRVRLLMWAGAWWAGIYILLRFGFTAPIPSSVITIYMGIVSLAILAYVSSSEQRREEVSGPLSAAHRDAIRTARHPVVNAMGRIRRAAITAPPPPCREASAP